MNSQNKSKKPVVISIAGSDSSGGAGIQADLKTFHALGVYGTTAVTCVTAQSPCGVAGVQVIEPDFIVQQVRAVLDWAPVAAVKTGMLFSKEIIQAVAVAIPPGVPLVVDPVMVSRAGDTLIAPDAVSAYKTHLFPRASVVTPNRYEAAVLLDISFEDLKKLPAEEIAQSLYERYNVPFAVKNNPINGQAIDVFCDGLGLRTNASEAISNVHTHGTGCTFSAAVAAHLAHGKTVSAACALAKQNVVSGLFYSAEVGPESMLWHCSIS